jgi:hypothetical protein
MSLLQDDKRRLKAIRAESTCVRGGAHKHEDDILTIYRYRLVGDSLNALTKEIDRLRPIAQTDGELARQIAALELMKVTLTGFRDGAAFKKLPLALQKVKW